ncbi:putative ABC-type sugar transport systems,permease component [Vibrio nigripulchritudo MADA3029]|uniref:ABC-type sugar transport systems,permease component n=2 Tax=Vibrio nigripulchritudo TaxID=28173 RepID=A0AAV2VKB0_9VIBR|nr:MULTISPECIES: sugar ABC transporter permease [Vibrio]UAB73340.1 sugar ABC transporter permease [Vibrio sp. SCSIO 43132]CCN45963.1 putative ABC-type sugar transport systems,permease component [Vibrio nigripulchritudo MADA3020]CCN55231.1 putative ABC-type sugar transport systems,permease component [Vibrio nigripulchritudo MADA3021]CCN62352.1 putative ABC-type sugar transport systems,permease component [Vibrio nigripulchritudo MADA3029]CCN73619.1 putative ABC-type sugar transport systems,perme
MKEDDLVIKREIARRKRNRRLWLAFLLFPPAAILFVFVFLPMGSALWYSVYDWNGLIRGEFVGLQNFKDVLLDPNRNWYLFNALKNNVIVFVTLMIIQNGIALILALLLARDPKGGRFYQVVFFLPVILSTVIIGFQWKMFLNPFFGLINKGLNFIGLNEWALPWLGLTETALPSMLLVNAWAWVGFPTLVFLAAIHRIPKDFIEAARLDGASEWQIAKDIIWPLMAPAVTIIVVLTFIGSFNWFELPFIMSGLEGSPSYSTDMLGLLFYRTAFGSVSAGGTEFGAGSALAVLIFIFIFVFSIIATKLLTAREVKMD